MTKNRLDILMHPAVILTGVMAGLLITVYAKSIVPALRPFGNIYMALLQMCVFPILISSVTLSVARLIRSSSFGKDFKKLLLVFLIFLVSASVISIAAAVSFKSVLKPDEATLNGIGRIMIMNDDRGVAGNSASLINEISSEYEVSGEKKTGILLKFFLNIIPHNVFNTLNNGETIKIIFFFVLFGLSLKFINKNSYDSIMMIFSGVNEAFQKVVNGVIYFMPFALCILIADQFSDLGMNMLLPLMKLLGVITFTAFLLFIISTVVIWRFTGTGYFEQFSKLKKVIMVTLTTRSSFVAIPSAINELIEGFNLDDDRVNLIMPLGVTLCRYGSISIFSVTAVFAAYLYNYPLTAESFVIIVIASIFAALSTSGTPGAIAMTMVSILISALGLPTGAVIIILITLLPFIDPVDTILNVYPNCAICAVIANKKMEN